MPLNFTLDGSSTSLSFDSPLLEAVLIERPNRYVAKIAFADGVVQRAHVPVGGRIGGLTLDGLPCLLSGPYLGRSTDYTVEAIGSHYDRTAPGFQWIGINQTASNRYVGAFLGSELLPDLAGDLAGSSLKRERMLGQKRIDFSLGCSDPVELWIEVKTPLISLATELDDELPLRTDFGQAAPSARMPEQFEELARELKMGSRVVFLGVFGYRRNGEHSASERYRANLNLDSLVDRGLELGMEFWELELSMDSHSLELSTYGEIA